MKLRLGVWLTFIAAIVVIVYFALSQGGNFYWCPGARPCMFCARLPAHRDPCFGGCPRGGNCQLTLPVDGSCPDERVTVGLVGYSVCIRHPELPEYREHLCCRPDHGCTANPFEPNGQWGPCLRMAYQCFDPSTGQECPFVVWGEGRFCSEENGRPCCDPDKPCTP